jgi:hypothetical protein
MNLLSLINSSLEIVYCSTTLSNYNLNRLNRFVLWNKFVINTRLILLILSIGRLDVMMKVVIFTDRNKRRPQLNSVFIKLSPSHITHGYISCIDLLTKRKGDNFFT